MPASRRSFIAWLGAAVGGCIAACTGGAVAPATPTATTSATRAAATPSPAAASPTAGPSPAPTAEPRLTGCEKDAAGRVKFVDTHAHLDGRLSGGATNYDGAADTSLGTADAVSERFEITMPMPFPANDSAAFDYDALAPAVRKRVSRMAFMGGGGTLNVMIQQAIAAGSVSGDLQRRFEDKATEIVSAGGVGFGEMAAEHLSFNPRHPYVTAPPDHPLFLVLADLAARFDVPIDLHMMAVTRDMPTPQQFLQVSPNNPRTLKENVSGFERLLSRNLSARIVWAHAGGQFVGVGDAALARRLLDAHPNLYLQLKPESSSGSLVDAAGNVKPDWLDLIRSFPDRMVLGGDNFYQAPGAVTPFQRPRNNLTNARAFVDKLGGDLGCKVAMENAIRVYRLA